MSMTCLVCRSDQRDHIDHALVAGEPVRDVAGRVGISKSTIDRHRAHVPAALRLVATARAAEHGIDLLEAARGLLVKATGLLESAEAKGDIRGAVAALKECRATVEWLGCIDADRGADRDADLERIGSILMAELDTHTLLRVGDRLAEVGL